MGAMYEEIRVESRTSRLYPLFYFFHRCSIIFAAIFIAPITSIQIVVIMIVTMIYFIFVGNEMPFKQKLKNRIEIINITIVYWLSALNTFDTQYCKNNDIRYNVGWI